MSRETMTPKERWLAVLKREKPDRVPMDYWATEEATDKLLRHLGCADLRALYERLHIDRVITVGPLLIGGTAGPRFVGPTVKEDCDVYGCRYRDVDYGTGVYRECIYNPLAQYEAIEQIEANYQWPSPDWWDYSEIAAQIKGWEDYPIQGGGSEPFLIYKNLRGQEQAMIDLIEHADIVHYCLDKLFALAYQNSLRIYEQIPGKVTLSYVAEDMGGQTGLLFSAKHIREFLIPRMKRIIDLAHQAGAYVFHHTDGAARDIIPDMIAAGIDILNPIQWRCPGMEREGLKQDFGDKIVFHGGVDNQYTLPFGMVDEVCQEVRDNLRILGAGGGYILAPCHNIQAVSPPENIVAMYETGYEEGWL
ncbi:MAG: uroporphyrinogen decarboxylase family protein [Anaerolineae bacterium]